MLKRIETLANVSIIVVSLLLGTILVKRYVLSPASASQPTPPKAGSRVNLPDVDWRSKRQTVLVVLKPGCHFCSASAPFYSRLSEEAARKEIQLVAVLQEPVGVSQAYLSEQKIPIAAVRQADLSALNVRGTPTVLLVDRNGLLVRAWTGKLTPDGEAELLKML